MYVYINQMERCPQDQMHFLSVAANIATHSGPFKVRREKRKKRIATCKPCIAQIHSFTKSAISKKREEYHSVSESSSPNFTS